mmetsp:Transcript_52090/g.62690  ORF Transcript_52090/g.62690 Transcript_52090/m.62690 type:complete len:114 (-) Transcript_52090:213-554(-)
MNKILFQMKQPQSEHSYYQMVKEGDLPCPLIPREEEFSTIIAFGATGEDDSVELARHLIPISDGLENCSVLMLQPCKVKRLMEKSSQKSDTLGDRHIIKERQEWIGTEKKATN